MLPKILKNFNLYVDGRGYAGRVEEITLPKLTLKTEEFLGAGMSAPVEIDMGMEKLEMDLTFAEYDPELFKLFGLTNGSEIAFTIRGVLGGTDAEFVIINVRGFFKELDLDTWKPAEKAALKCSIACTYYKLSINGIELIEMVRNVNGSDQLAQFREILQI
jgi:P2 family phage contractile tail tube protein